jgi:hypothetical protein
MQGKFDSLQKKEKVQKKKEMFSTIWLRIKADSAYVDIKAIK